MTMTKLDYYGPEMTERRETFNQIINGIDMVLMNNIAEVDPSVYENWEGRSLSAKDCEITDGTCTVHDCDDFSNSEENCAGYYDEMDNSEVYQWFAINDNDADYLKRHNQYITYSDMLDTYFLAILHFGTSWDYVDSMVNDILKDK